MPPDEPAKPLLVGRYALYDKIGQGGMASVHIGRLLGPAGFSRTVAIKRLHPHFSEDADFVSMFLDEARVAGRIRHLNVVPTVDVVAAEGELFLVMEYVQGESLNRLLGSVVAEKSHVPPRVASAILCDVLHGLHAAHEAKSDGGEPLCIVHRDVSPQNVLVGVDGTARVLDFGIAKAVSRLHTTREGQLKGKLAYMAPEQLKGVAADARSDVYSAAVVLWETLTAQRLYAAEGEADLAARIQEGEIPPPSELMSDEVRADLSDATLEQLDAVVLTGLARDVDKRFQSAQAMATALADCLPPAPRAQVAAWVERMAKTSLGRRAVIVARIEKDASLPAGPGAEEILAALKSAPPPAPASPADTGRTGGARSGPALPPQRSARSRALLSALAAALALGVAVLALRRGEPPRPPAAAPKASNSARAVTDFPLPASASPDALAAYRSGLQAIRDGSFGAAVEAFGHATALDPGLAAAQLRRAVGDSLFMTDEIQTRQAFAKAVQLRDELSPRDRALLEALEPYLQRDPADLDETDARVSQVAARYPDDAEMAFYSGLFHYSRGRHADAQATFERAARLDPRFTLALAYEGGARAYEGDLEGARRTLDRCVASSPSGTECLFFRSVLDEQEGRCADEEADAKLWIARDPEDHYAYQVLAHAMSAEGHPAEATAVALAEKWKHVPASTRSWREPLDRARLAALAGNFTHAEELLTSLLASTGATDSSARSHSLPTSLLIEIYEETDRMPLARKLAEDFLKQTDVWVAPHLADDVSIARDPIPGLLATLRDSGAIGTAEFERQRGRWLDLWRARAAGLYTRYLWIYGYAWPAETPEQATAALAAVGPWSPVPTYAPLSIGLAYVGRAYLLAGRIDEAITMLRSATSACLALEYPLEHTRAYADLGAALEAKGDGRGACAAYQVLLGRWGDAKPRSRTLDRTRRRVAALGCGGG